MTPFRFSCFIACAAILTCTLSGCRGCNEKPSTVRDSGFDTQGYDSLDVAALEAIRPSQPSPEPAAAGASAPPPPPPSTEADLKFQRKQDSLIMQQIAASPTSGLTAEQKKAYVVAMAQRYLDNRDSLVRDSVFRIMTQPDMIPLYRKDVDFQAAMQPFVEAQ